MARSRRWQLVALAVVAALPSLGCGLVHRPYANDPILRERGPVWGHPERSRGSADTQHAEPAAPHAPTILPPLPEKWVVTEPITSR
jgi:hypothetical protein